jgi:hypothetical protein
MSFAVAGFDAKIAPIASSKSTQLSASSRGERSGLAGALPERVARRYTSAVREPSHTSEIKRMVIGIRSYFVRFMSIPCRLSDDPHMSCPFGTT